MYILQVFYGLQELLDTIIGVGLTLLFNGSRAPCSSREVLSLYLFSIAKEYAIIKATAMGKRDATYYLIDTSIL